MNCWNFFIVKDGFGNVSAGCVPCNCNIVGSENLICDSITGQCSCKKGVTGVLCDSCMTDFYGFHAGVGCKGKWMNLFCVSSLKISRLCYCNLLNTHIIIECKCNTTGSIQTHCEPILGQCDCRENVIGRTCDQCKVIYIFKLAHLNFVCFLLIYLFLYAFRKDIGVWMKKVANLASVML